MKKDRLTCSHEKMCGCNHTPKKRQGKDFIVVADSVINPAMEQCGKFTTWPSTTKYCCLTREMVHLLK